jgi:hypothetical protein
MYYNQDIQSKCFDILSQVYNYTLDFINIYHINNMIYAIQDNENDLNTVPLITGMYYSSEKITPLVMALK